MSEFVAHASKYNMEVSSVHFLSVTDKLTHQVILPILNKIHNSGNSHIPSWSLNLAKKSGFCSNINEELLIYTHSTMFFFNFMFKSTGNSLPVQSEVITSSDKN